MVHAPDMNDPVAIKADYLKRHSVYHQLVGSLYPSIVYAELMELRERYVQLTKSSHFWGDLLPVNPPNEYGYVS